MDIKKEVVEEVAFGLENKFYEIFNLAVGDEENIIEFDDDTSSLLITGKIECIEIASFLKDLGHSLKDKTYDDCITESCHGQKVF